MAEPKLVEKRPVSQARPGLRLHFKNLSDIKHIDFGRRVTSIKFGSTLNSGYIVKFNLQDPHFNTLNKIVSSGYFKTGRSQHIEIEFEILASRDGGEYPRSATKKQIAYVTGIQAAGSAADTANLEFVAIDPASYLLNRGSGSGKAYTGKISNVIQQVVGEYARDITLDISETIDSDKNKHWMMRQDPQSFIASLLEWSSPFTQNKTQWLVSSDGLKLQIKEQAEIKPRQRAYYTFWEPGSVPGRDTIRSWELITDNALSLSHNKIISQGLSAVSGAYFDKITDQKEEKTVVKDETTSRKIIASVDDEKAFTKPNEQFEGVTSVSAIPEMYSAGDIGLKYDDYIDGKARNLWLNLTRNLIRCKFRVLGHGEWSEGTGLGVDSILTMWTTAPRDLEEPAKEWFLSGNWLVYGFEHIMSRRHWWTDIYAARFDHDASGTPTPTS
jgi:hypothetical protein